MATIFEWDESKAEANVHKHGVNFDEAQTIFLDDLAILLLDPEHSAREERWLIIGTSDRRRLLVISFTERGKKIRLISARKATRVERNQYEEEDHF